MSRKVVGLTIDTVEDVSSACRGCAYWSAGARDQDERAWMVETLTEWGTCGQLLYVDGVAAGHLLYAPSAYVPRAMGFATSPVSADAVLLMTGQLAGAYRGAGLGKLLVQGMARDAVHRGFKAVEAFGVTNPGGTFHRSEPCLLPAGFLEAVGFKVVRAHSSTPRLRMEIKTMLAWKAEVETAIDKLMGAMQPARTPARGS